MSYTKHEFKSGEKLFASQLNEMDEQIFKNEKILSEIGGTTVEPAEDDIPKVFFSGDVTGMSKDDAKDLQIVYRSKSLSFDGTVEMKWQGSSSIQYPKKNFTIKMYTDSGKESKLKKDFRGWGEQNKFCLKANYIDHSHARNIVSARLWDDIVKSRSDYATLPAGLRNSPNSGAIDGFPIKLYMNGVYQGIYTWNIPKDGWMFNIDEANTGECVLCCEYNNSATPGVPGAYPSCEFRGLWGGNGDGNWSVEFPDSASAAIVTSFNNLISCVKDTDDETFKATIGNYLDVQSAIDYYLFVYFGCFNDNLARNMIMATYDGTKWFCSAYDMDSTWGNTITGGSFVATDYACPEAYQESYSLLWQRLEKVFYSELKARYSELRASALSLTNVIDKFERFTDVIGANLYSEDLIPYPNIPQPSANNIRQIRKYAAERAVYVDAEIAALDGSSFCDRDGDGQDDYITIIPCTGITLSHDTLTFDATNSQTVTATVTPENTTNPVLWASDNNAVATVSGGVVTAVGKGSCTITATCGEYSDTCVVTVDVSNEGNILSGIEIVNAYINGDTGEFVEPSPVSRASSLFDISAYAGNHMIAEFTGATSGNTRVAFYDEDENILEWKTATDLIAFRVPDNAKSMRFSLLATDFNSVKIYTMQNNLFDATTAVTGKYYQPESGVLASYSPGSCQKVNIPSNTMFYVYKVRNSAIFDVDDVFVVSGATCIKDGDDGAARVFVMPETGAIFGANVDNATINDVFIAYDKSEIGSYTYNG